MANNNFDKTKVVCTCGVHVREHKSGRCADAILHRLAYEETPIMKPAGTLYVDGIREYSLFEDDLVVERNGELFIVPEYTKDPAEAFKLFSKWYDIGGTARINMNRSGWSATFHHGILRNYYGYGTMNRSRLEWLSVRELLLRWVEFLRLAKVSDCDWIEGVPSMVHDDPDPA